MFELRRYVFPPDEPIQRRTGPREFHPFPRKEYVVLSTSTGKAFAIWEDKGYFAGIYNYGRMRVKLDMHTNQISSMTREEVADSPVGFRRIFTRNFRVEHVNTADQHLLPYEVEAVKRKGSF